MQVSKLFLPAAYPQSLSSDRLGYILGVGDREIIMLKRLMEYRENLLMLNQCPININFI